MFFKLIGLTQTVFVVLALSNMLSACNVLSNEQPQSILGSDHVQGKPGLLPQGTGENPGGPGGTAVLGESCRSSDTNHICLALKYVAYQDPSGRAVVTSEEAIANVKQVNAIWGQCHLGFQIESYTSANPSAYGLTFQPSDYSDLDNIRNAFVDDQSLLLVTTGSWDRSGTLGETGANAWTSLPDGPPYGAVLEKPVATYANILAHELGHYLNLGHISNSGDLMNPIIYQNSTALSDSQCATTRAAATYWWQKMLRS